MLSGYRHVRLASAAILPLLAAAQAPAPARPVAPLPTVQVPARAAQPSQFVPEGWVVEQQEVADFNGDGLADALLMMRPREANGVPQRILAVVLRQRGAGYKLAEVNRRLIPQADSAQEDPMADGELDARRGGFDIKLTLMAGSGSYLTAAVRYRFRYEGRLLPADRLRPDGDPPRHAGHPRSEHQLPHGHCGTPHGQPAIGGR